ncbi:hypothetical protein HU200_050148 [Digitaria exilis]|uniref:Uncharacterized protein n=1 Tax=Digitaria exilis TaxID=1010633 RepID=A0A835AXS2_9POAL|nr:hypothetical protein HU200_050148 [Digitaria exilis]
MRASSTWYFAFGRGAITLAIENKIVIAAGTYIGERNAMRRWSSVEPTVPSAALSVFLNPHRS